MKFKRILKENFYIPVVVLIVAVINIFFVRTGMTIGQSMEPTLKNGSLLLIDLREEINRKDIIVFKRDGEIKHLVKRVIGLPGETVQIKDNLIYINDEPITDAVIVRMEDYGMAENPVTLDEDEYFVMGDNRNNSFDSRIFGAVKENEVLGVVKYPKR